LQGEIATVKPLYVVGTERHVGKTTFCLGLINALRERGMSVGYTKPLGQRVSEFAGQPIHDDALVISKAMGMDAGEASMAVPLVRGRVEKEIYDLHTPELSERVAATCRRLADDHDVVVLEGMGHVAMGSCLKMSAAEVAQIVGARTLLISGGGIGRAIDAISLCMTFMSARGAEMMGAVVNKVWPEKYRRVSEATRKGLENIGIRSFGTVPYDEVLASPTVGQVAEQLTCEVLCGTEALDNRIGKTVVAAMEPDHMVSYLKDRAFVITPGDRSDNILAILSTHLIGLGAQPTVSGVVLTGGFRPAGQVMGLLASSGVPALLCRDDTYSLAARLREMVFKITPEDQDRIGAAMCLVNEYVDIDGILASLSE
jgi:hypothetical protein